MDRSCQKASFERTGRTIALFAVILAGALTVLFCISSSEPVYKGRRLSSWLKDLNPPSSARPGLREEAVAAMQHIGAEALPILIEHFNSRDSKWKVAAMSLLARQPLFVVQWLPASQRRLNALFGIEALGAAAAPLVPELILVLDGTNTSARPLAAQALGAIDAAHHITVPALTNALHDGEITVRIAAAESLRRLAKHPEIAAPALVKRIEVSTGLEFEQVTAAMLRFRPSATSAIPAFRLRMADADATVRKNASNALFMLQFQRPRPQ
jgi:HEAT repeat protein